MVATEIVLHEGRQPGTGDTMRHSVRVDPDADGTDALVFTERYRFDDDRAFDPAAYSYEVRTGVDGIALLGPDVGTELRRRYASGELDASLPPGRNRARLLRAFDHAGVRTERGGQDRIETLWGDGTSWVELTINTYGGYLGVCEWHPGRNLYQVKLRPEAHVAMLAVAEDRAGPQRGHPDDRVVAGWRALGAQFRPGRPGAIRDQVAGWLRAAQVAFDSYGTDWTEPLLTAHRVATDCVFSLRLTLDPADQRRGVRFVEHYDYLPGSGDAGREYAYSATAAYADVTRIADGLGGGPEAGETAGERLIAGLHAKVSIGELGDHLAIEDNRDRVAGWFRAAGADVELDRSSWFNTDW